jgi:basic membrane protein A
MDSKNGNFTAGLQMLGVAEGGVDWALDENNASLITSEMKAAVEQARADIISGKVTVHNYESDSACPY